MSTMTGEPVAVEPPRNTVQAIWRGLIGRCPECGQGRMFRAYLKVSDRCPVCREELHHQRADDAPPYITMFIVGHIVVALLLAAEVFFADVSLWLEALVFCLATAALSLLLLPRIKGALVALQWSLRMHGFGSGEIKDASAPDLT